MAAATRLATANQTCSPNAAISHREGISDSESQTRCVAQAHERLL